MIEKLILRYGRDILLSDGMTLEKSLMQHGATTVFEHSLNVTYMSVYIAKKLHLKVDYDALIRGALLHDYFLYDWHIGDGSGKLHGFAHAGNALRNARRDFYLNAISQDIIKKHMFPLNITPPKYKESYLVCLADKICAVAETAKFRLHRFERISVFARPAF